MRGTLVARCSLHGSRVTSDESQKKADAGYSNMNKAFVDYYRCPEKLAKFVIDGTLSEEPGYFSFGNDIVCYGRTHIGHMPSNPQEPLYDVLPYCKCSNGLCALPFDLSETVNLLRNEVYTQAASYGLTRQLVHAVAQHLYYLLRPLLPVAVRRYAQRCFLRGWDKIVFPRWPVDHTVDSIMERLLWLTLKARHSNSLPFIWFWPDGYSSCAIMTHDVETASGKDFCTELMDIDEAYGIKASFQVVPEKRYAVSTEFLAAIQDRGFEINIHGLCHDGRLFQKRSIFQRRVERINQYGREFRALGFRSPVLYHNQDWFDELEFEYDMSVPNVGHLDPQHGGCCTVMPYFIGHLVELPLTTTQDYSLFHILNQYSIELWQQQIELILQKHGLITFLVHPDYLLSDKTLRTYKQLLDYLCSIRQKRNLWFALPRQVSEWWRNRSKMQLIQTNGKWLITGSDSDRARIAYARLQDDRVVYDLQ